MVKFILTLLVIIQWTCLHNVCVHINKNKHMWESLCGASRALPQKFSTLCDFINKSLCFPSVLGFFFNFKTHIYWNDRGQMSRCLAPRCWQKQALMTYIHLNFFFGFQTEKILRSTFFLCDINLHNLIITPLCVSLSD